MNIEKVDNTQTAIVASNSRKNRIMLYIVETLISIGIIGILVPVIVDISINKRLTWSLISGSSILYFYSGLITFFVCKSGKCMKALAVYSIGLIPYLFVLEITIDYLYLNPSQDRFMEYALPISALWLAIIWGDILFGKIVNMNVWYRISLLCLLAIIGTSLTNAVAYKISWIETFDKFQLKIEVLEYIVCAIFFFCLGTFRKINKKLA